MADTDKDAKDSRNVRSQGTKKEVQFGIAFDVDGVLARGTVPLQAALDMIKLLQDENEAVKVPIAFVTNALNKDVDKAKQITGWLGIPITTNQMIESQGPLEVFTAFHNLHCLIVGQGDIKAIARIAGLKNTCTVEDIAEAYPLLDMVDHDNRVRVATEGYVEKPFPKVEAIIMMGEPQRWESCLQLIIDLLITDGKPDHMPTEIPQPHLPVIACNMDLFYIDRAVIPRYGHGAFLVCIEALYKKVTGHPLTYTALVGKPSEITFRYAEHCLRKEAKRMGIEAPMERLYMIGDTPQVDIAGANLYQRYIDRLRTYQSNLQPEVNGAVPASGEKSFRDDSVPACRQVPRGASFLPQTVTEVTAVLVCTGVYNPEVSESVDDIKDSHGHHMFPRDPTLKKPAKLCEGVYEAIQYILAKENVSFQ